MKKNVILLWVALLATTYLSKAAVSVDRIWYELDYNTLTASVLPRGGVYYTDGNRYEGDIVIPETIVKYNTTYTVTSINENAFRDCIYLTSVSIPNTITSIGEDAFTGTTSLSEPVYNSHLFARLPTSYSGAYTIPDGIETICGYAFYYCQDLTAIEIPMTVTSIKNKAFGFCTGLTAVSIPNSVTTVESMAFFACSSLTAINIPTNVINIAGGTFSSCDHLSSIVIPSNVQSIGIAFDNCSRLTTVTIEATTPPNCSGDIFMGCNNLRSIYVPCGSLSNYKAAGGWNSHESIIKYFELPYTLTAYAEHGNVFCPQNICEGDALMVSPDYGYHFEQWTDGVTDNPRTIVSTKDTTFTALCERNSYEISVMSNSTDIGTVNDVSGSYNHGDSLELSANVSLYGYSFDYWSIISYVPEDAISVSQAIQIASQLENGVASRQKYKIYGYVTRKYGNYENSYYLSDNPNQLGTFVVFKALNSAQIGDYILVEAYLCNNNSISETDQDGIITPLQQQIYQNPYNLIVNIGSSITAYFKPNKYGVNLLCDEKGLVRGGGLHDYLSSVQISAESIYGYHFTQWSDGNTDNPRTIILTQDTTFTAEFAPNKYELYVKANSDIMGNVTGSGVYDYNSDVVVSATPNYGYSFCYWKRLFIPQDAIPASQAYQIASALASGATTSRTYRVYGYVSRSYGYGNSYYIADNPGEEGMFVIYRALQSANIGDVVLVEAKLTNYKGTTPETVEGGKLSVLTPDVYSTEYIVHVTKDDTIKAYFKANTYTIFDETDTTRGYVSGIGSYDYLTEQTLTAVPDYGYHFTHWSDGIQDNPRNIVLTQDTTVIAEFEADKSGFCGKDSALTWSYDDKSKTLTITGNGALTDNYTYGAEAPTQMNTLIIGDGVTAIGDSAFYGMTTINHLFIGANVASIGNYAFAECKNFDDITCYATIVPTINATTFANIGNKQYIYLYVPEDRERAYKRDAFWGLFDIRIKGTEETTTDTNSVTVEPTDNTALFTWPIDNDAASYSLQITRDGEVFCTLTFNSNGQLTGIAFTPSRNEAAYAKAATMSVSAMSFTVTGLNSASKYAYHLAVKDANENEIQAYSGEFATTGYEGEVNPGGNPEHGTEGLKDVLSTEKATKVLHNGQILILRGDRTYTLTGQEVR